MKIEVFSRAEDGEYFIKMLLLPLTRQTSWNKLWYNGEFIPYGLQCADSSHLPTAANTQPWPSNQSISPSYPLRLVLKRQMNQSRALPRTFTRRSKKEVYRYFLKVYFMPPRFYERPTSVPVFVDQKKSREDFCFYEKKAKSENSIQGLLGSKLLQRQ